MNNQGWTCDGWKRKRVSGPNEQEDNMDITQPTLPPGKPTGNF